MRRSEIGTQRKRSRLMKFLLGPGQAHAAPDGIILEERPERAVQMNAHRYKVAAILLLASSIAPAPPRRLFKAFTSSTR